jgi:hypothetical protein
MGQASPRFADTWSRLGESLSGPSTAPLDRFRHCGRACTARTGARNMRDAREAGGNPCDGLAQPEGRPGRVPTAFFWHCVSS